MTQWADPDLALWVMEREQSREWQEASVHGRERAKVRGLQPAFWPRPLELTVAAILVTVPNMTLVKRDFLSSCPCKEREGLWTTAHQGTCLMKVTLSVLWTWENCKLSIYKWSLLNPILHECWNACNTYKAESYWLRNTGLQFNASYDYYAPPKYHLPIWGYFYPVESRDYAVHWDKNKYS